MQHVLSLILGGGRGSRLYPLTMLRSKPAVPIAAKYRLIDIPISNCINSGFNRIYVLTQFLSVSLHGTSATRTSSIRSARGSSRCSPRNKPTRRPTGTRARPTPCASKFAMCTRMAAVTCSSSAATRFTAWIFTSSSKTHRDSKADMTIAVLPVSGEQASAFGLVRLDDGGRVIGFVEKPKTREEQAPWKTPAEWLERREFRSPGRPFLASMGIYLFTRDALFRTLNEPPLATDFGKEIFPRSIDKYHVQAHLFDGYWEDVGTVKAYHEASLQLTRENPPFDFHSPEGVIYTRMRYLPASRVLNASLDQCLLGDGCLVQSGAKIQRCILGIRTMVGPNATCATP